MPLPKLPRAALAPALAVVLLAAAALAPAFAGCGSPGELKLCGQIPLDGCPIGRGGTCDDALCAALYDCVEGAWTPVESCSGFSGGAGGAGGAGGGGGVGGCEPFSFDKTGETTGCEPDLQSPDCPASAAEICAASACLTECIDFYLCMKDGWVDVAYCDEEGHLIILQEGL
jgi:hypothetical protein